jgi:hypothetical protein
MLIVTLDNLIVTSNKLYYYFVVYIVLNPSIVYGLYLYPMCTLYFHQLNL